MKKEYAIFGFDNDYPTHHNFNPNILTLVSDGYETKEEAIMEIKEWLPYADDPNMATKYIVLPYYRR